MLSTWVYFYVVEKITYFIVKLTLPTNLHWAELLTKMIHTLCISITPVFYDHFLKMILNKCPCLTCSLNL